MPKENDPLFYADEIVKILANTDQSTARTALKIAVPLLDYRIFTASGEAAPQEQSAVLPEDA